MTIFSHLKSQHRDYDVDSFRLVAALQQWNSIRTKGLDNYNVGSYSVINQLEILCTYDSGITLKTLTAKDFENMFGMIEIKITKVLCQKCRTYLKR